MGDALDGQWLTYHEPASASRQLGVGRCEVNGGDSRGTTGMTRVMPPDDWRAPGAPSRRTDGTPLLIEMLKAQTAGLQAHIESLKAKIAAADTRDAERLAELAHERELAHKAISAFAALAERLDALAAGRAKPWWRRLVG